MTIVVAVYIIYVGSMVRDVRSQEENSANRATTKPGSTELLHTECWLYST